MGNIGRSKVAKLVTNNINRHFKKIIGSKPMQWRKERKIIKSTQILKYNGWILPPEQMETEERSEGIV